MTDAEAPKIVFPCTYPVKVMGYACAEFHEHVISVMEQHAPGFDRTEIVVRDSRNGKFQAVTVRITATGEKQLQAIFEDLKTSAHVQMVL
ncbi:MAG: DUF493 domain-containing protein [Porticoccaceae bacterium]|jgi:putative lipoic acid-binding regulatory protein|nr:DUF493 domain-containing protein [Porticoccaceae bacterium]